MYKILSECLKPLHFYFTKHCLWYLYSLGTRYREHHGVGEFLKWASKALVPATCEGLIHYLIQAHLVSFPILLTTESGLQNLKKN